MKGRDENIDGVLLGWTLTLALLASLSLVFTNNVVFKILDFFFVGIPCYCWFPLISAQYENQLANSYPSQCHQV